MLLDTEKDNYGGIHMQIKNTEGIESLHIWVTLNYNPVKWIESPIFMEHKRFEKNTYVSENYITPVRGTVVEGSPYERFKKLIMVLKQRVGFQSSEFYLIECEVPKNFVIGDTGVIMPYVASPWIRAIDYFKLAEYNGDYFKYYCDVLYENEYGSLVRGAKFIEPSLKTLQGLLDRVNEVRDPGVAYNRLISNNDIINSLITYCKELDMESEKFKTLYSYLESDIVKGEFLAFDGNKKIYLDSNPLLSLKYLWESYWGEDSSTEEVELDFNNLPDYVLNADKALKNIEIEKEREKERERIRKEKERIRKEKEEIARKKRYYGPHADKVDDRVRQDQNSFGWWANWVASKVTFGLIRPPKTLRSDDYREQFIKKNPGLFIKGFYLCIYCGRPIMAKSEDKNWKMYVDHIEPINQGGRNNTWNLGPACLKCNTAKSDKGGEWVVRGYIGKVGFTALQLSSNVIKTLFTGYKDKNVIKKFISLGFYGITGLWLLQFLF